MSAWPTRRLGDIAPLVRRPVDVNPDKVYREIGVRSFGKGIFHKAPVTGLELGDKRVFWIAPGDLVFNIVFAWEGAVAFADASEEGMIGSHRFLTCVVDEGVASARFLKWWFAHPAGREQLLRASPGGAGRNRTLGIEKLGAIEVPLPTLDEQRRIVARINRAYNLIRKSEQSNVETNQYVTRIVESYINTMPSVNVVSMSELLCSSDLRNGKSIKSSESSSEIRCLTLAAVRDGSIDVSCAKPVPIDVDEAERFSVHAADVLIVRGSGSKHFCGIAGIVHSEPKDCTIFPDLLIKISLPADVIDSRYFIIMWNGPFVRRQLEGMAKTTSGIWKINQRHIEAVQIPLPSLHAQHRIVTEVEALCVKVDAVKVLQAERAKALDALLPAILDRAFKGEL